MHLHRLYTIPNCLLFVGIIGIMIIIYIQIKHKKQAVAIG